MAGNEPLWMNSDIDNAGAGNNDFGVSGLNILPAGYRRGAANYLGLTSHTYLWSSLESINGAWRRDLLFWKTNIHRHDEDDSYGLSVRCLKD